MKDSSSYPRIGEEIIPPDEEVNTERILSILRSIQERNDRKQTPMKRNVHPKQHGCLLAELSIDDHLTDELRHGLFRHPHTFSALVRYSNSKQPDDRLPDAHGMAIKLIDVPGEKLLTNEPAASTHDFVLIDHPVFFARDVADMLPLARDFERLMVGGLFDKARTVLKAALSQDHRFSLIRKAGAKRPHNPFEIQYWSTTPYKFGASAAKFSLRPQLDYLPKPPINSPDRLRLAMAAHLRERGARFEFLVQLQTNPRTMPIEDATALWDERESPLRKLATLTIPPQTFDTHTQQAFGEQLSFTPWHAIPEHRPLGGINRARRKIYEVLATRRHNANGVPKREPTADEVVTFFGRSR